MDEKKKHEIAGVMDGCVDIFEDTASAAELFAKASRKAVTVVTALRSIFSITEKAEPLPTEEPKKVTAAKKKKDPEPETEQPGETAPAAKEYTKEDVRKYLAGIADHHRTEVKALLTKYGADNLTQLDPANYAAIMADAEEIANA